MISNTSFIIDLASKGKRADGRKEDEFRKVIVEKNVIEKAEGSALVRIGSTQVLVGVKMGVQVPFPDAQKEGVLMVGAEFSPIASPDFESGPPREDSIELARVVDRGIRESGAIDVEKLCIKEGEKVWTVFVDIQILDDGGNLLDASALAATSALLNAKFPKYEDDKVIPEEKTNKKLPLKCKPVAVTHVKIGDKFFVDPSSEELAASSAWLSVGTKDDGNIAAIQKGGRAGLTFEEVENLLKASIEKGKELRKLLD